MARKAVPGRVAAASEGMGYLDRFPQRLFQVYAPLSVLLFVLLFPFYWMAMTSLQAGCGDV